MSTPTNCSCRTPRSHSAHTAGFSLQLPSFTGEKRKGDDYAAEKDYARHIQSFVQENRTGQVGRSVREPVRAPKRVTLALKQLNMQAY